MGKCSAMDAEYELKAPSGWNCKLRWHGNYIKDSNVVGFAHKSYISILNRKPPIEEKYLNITSCGDLLFADSSTLLYPKP